MSSLFRQTGAMLRANLFSLRHRLAISLSMVLSVALVVAVLAGFLAMAEGFETALTSAGSPRVAVVLGGGTNQETGSDLPAGAVRTIMAMGSALGVVSGIDGAPLASRELVVPVEMTTGRIARMLALRGMDADGPRVREGVTVSGGRLFAPGAREILVGDRLAANYPGFGVGDGVRLGAVTWTVAGHFSAGGSAFESEIWGDLDAVRAAFDRQGEVQSLRFRLGDPAALATLNDALGTIAATPLTAVSEADLYAGQSGRTSALIRGFGWPLALLMAIGATAGALNTMMSSVSDRTVQIATVRALGFSRFSAFLATWCEAVMLGAVGAGAGVVVSALAFDGWQASTVGANNASMGFMLAVTPDVMITAGLLGLAIGIVGGALPALAASRLPLLAALRARG